MKSMAMLTAATAAALVVNVSGALSQDVCSKAYGACMTACVEKMTRDAQDTCMISCQDKNSQCSAEMFGRQETSFAARSAADGKKAREITSPPPRKVDAAPRPADGGKDIGASRAVGSLRKLDIPPRKTDAKTETKTSPVREIPAESPN
jgi:hypothetical protein